ncbi:ESCRT-II complex, vps25 subunit [Lindgomyces ingoldianus]|uniref:ESCRT-II complex, vps25 subunit n=1 Tax=Lindgomyces ingoldianus TaxID=673940 RepID=A0ACB6QZ66_9PLEO|nr:ESCRT-II complex, vps25 subunit [Lindgomyces ingoldianus]KAF2472288.1 ESCRT-II complex, vps25 subunit [Lindgomyces ingoldianus]
MASSTASFSNFSTAPTLASNPPPAKPSLNPDEPPAFIFPPHYSFPPFFTLQPVLSTRTSQLASWSTLIQSYCRHHRLFTLSLIDALSTPLFTNSRIDRKLSLRDAWAIVSWMASAEGGNRAEWISSTTSTTSKKANAGVGEGEDGGGGKCYVYWRRPEEWAAVLEEWVERTGQRGTVLTLYEISDSDATRREEFYGIEAGLLARSLGVCVKRGKAQIFGAEGSEGVKFF